MYICYLDESGTPEKGDSSRHFVLLGLAVPASTWKEKDRQIDVVKMGYGLQGSEVHTAWMLRDLPEQARVPGFAAMDHDERRRHVIAIRTQNLARPRSNSAQRALEKNYRKTADYVHLTRAERTQCVSALADLIGQWGDARIFCEAQKKSALTNGEGDFEEAFEQVVTRFNTFLRNVGGLNGLMVQDNNETMAKRLTEMMRRFHREGTTWTRDIEHVVETPLFVDSSLTSMVQLADICAYAIRRFYDNDEANLLERIDPAFDRNGRKLVGVRHFTRADHCECRICVEHGRRPLARSAG